MMIYVLKLFFLDNFQLRGHDHPQDDATPNFFPDSKPLCKGFQMRYHLFLTIFGKVVKIKQTSFLLSKCLFSIAHHCKVNLG